MVRQLGIVFILQLSGLASVASLHNLNMYTYIILIGPLWLCIQWASFNNLKPVREAQILNNKNEHNCACNMNGLLRIFI